jgi:hypothetical protein
MRYVSKRVWANPEERYEREGKVYRRGDDWWEEPQNLREKILLDKVSQNTMRPLLGEKMIRRGRENWTKWEWVHRSPGGWKTVVHFWKTPQGERVTPKFKYVPPDKAREFRGVRSPDSPIDYLIENHDYPLNMREKLVYELVMSGEAPENEKLVAFSRVTKEPFIRLYKQGWRKWQHRHVSKAGRLTVVNFWMNKRGERILPKFMREARAYANPIRASFGARAGVPIDVIGPAYPGTVGYWNARFLDDGDEGVLPATSIYGTGGRWAEPRAPRPGRPAWTNNPRDWQPPACDPSKRPLRIKGLKGKFVRTHVNLHNGCFVVSYKSKVQGYSKALKLKDVRPRVGQAGWQRCNTSQVRNVHAYLDGELVSGKTSRKSGKGWRQISYHCKTHGPYFFFVDTDEPFKGAKEAICRKVKRGGQEKVEVWVRGPEPARKNPADCECGAPQGICSCGEVDSWIAGDPEKITPCGQAPRQVGAHTVTRPWGTAVLLLDVGNVMAYEPRDWHERGRCPLLAGFSAPTARVARSMLHEELAHYEHDVAMGGAGQLKNRELAQLARRVGIPLSQAEDMLVQEGHAWAEHEGQAARTMLLMNPCGHRHPRNPCPVCIGTVALGALGAAGLARRRR